MGFTQSNTAGLVRIYLPLKNKIKKSFIVPCVNSVSKTAFMATLEVIINGDSVFCRT